MNVSSRVARITRLTGVLMLVVATLTTPAHASESETAKEVAAKVKTLSTHLESLEEFIHHDFRGKQRLHPAARNTVPQGVYDLAQEILHFQRNAFSIVSTDTFATETQHTTRRSAPFGTPVDRYPLLAKLFRDAKVLTAIQESSTSSDFDLAQIATCGTFGLPMPSNNPPRELRGPFDDPLDTLLREGYHITRGYACGRPAEQHCGYDFTRGRAYDACPASAFRDQATRAGDGMVWFQEGEPNPELSDYKWPRWYWGAYVVWWHWAF